MMGFLVPALSFARRSAGAIAPAARRKLRLEVLMHRSIQRHVAHASACGSQTRVDVLRARHAAFSTVHTLAQIGPPMLNVAARPGLFTCTSAGARPSNCSALQPIIAMPVAPIGWPFAISPPDVLMPHSPSGAALP